MLSLFTELKDLVAEADDHVQKAEAGNKAARTRARKAMQAIKVKAQEIRVALHNSVADKAPKE